MEIAKEKNGLGIEYYTARGTYKKKRKLGILGNYKLFMTLVVFTLTFSIINIILIMNFFKILANF